MDRGFEEMNLWTSMSNNKIQRMRPITLTTECELSLLYLRQSNVVYVKEPTNVVTCLLVPLLSPLVAFSSHHVNGLALGCQVLASCSTGRQFH